MTIYFRPAKREKTLLTIGLAGPTKSGKTYSAHRLARGLANGRTVVMINAEGAKGHQYADKFDYLAADVTRPYRPQQYTDALRAAIALEPKPAVVIIDSMSHMHDGPGGMLEWHDEELDRLAGSDQKKRDRSNWSAWIKPKAAENEFIYTMLEADCHLILCFRAKEKLKIVTGKPPIELGWRPIAGDRVAFETIFTLTLPPHSKGVPDLSVSDMREPFDTMIPAGKPLDEETAKRLAEWAVGADSVISTHQRRSLAALAADRGVPDEAVKLIMLEQAGAQSSKEIPRDAYDAVVAAVESYGSAGDEAAPEASSSGGAATSPAPVEGSSGGDASVCLPSSPEEPSSLFVAPPLREDAA